MPRDEVREELVLVRVSGPASAVELVAWKLRGLIGLRVVEESLDHPNREGNGVKRYLSLMVPEDGTT